LAERPNDVNVATVVRVKATVGRFEIADAGTCGPVGYAAGTIDFILVMIAGQ
jgi:hypothetical protein